MICLTPNCRRILPKDAAFCTGCGKRLTGTGVLSLAKHTIPVVSATGPIDKRGEVGVVPTGLFKGGKDMLAESIHQKKLIGLAAFILLMGLQFGLNIDIIGWLYSSFSAVSSFVLRLFEHVTSKIF